MNAIISAIQQCYFGKEAVPELYPVLSRSLERIPLYIKEMQQSDSSEIKIKEDKKLDDQFEKFLEAKEKYEFRQTTSMELGALIPVIVCVACMILFPAAMAAVPPVALGLLCIAAAIISGIIIGSFFNKTSQIQEEKNSLQDKFIEHVRSDGDFKNKLINHLEVKREDSLWFIPWEKKYYIDLIAELEGIQ